MVYTSMQYPRFLSLRTNFQRPIHSTSISPSHFHTLWHHWYHHHFSHWSHLRPTYLGSPGDNREMAGTRTWWTRRSLFRRNCMVHRASRHKHHRQFHQCSERSHGTLSALHKYRARMYYCCCRWRMGNSPLENHQFRRNISGIYGRVCSLSRSNSRDPRSGLLAGQKTTY